MAVCFRNPGFHISVSAGNDECRRVDVIPPYCCYRFVLNLTAGAMQFDFCTVPDNGLSYRRLVVLPSGAKCMDAALGLARDDCVRSVHFRKSHPLTMSKPKVCTRKVLM